MTVGRFVLVIGLVIFGGLKIGPMKPMIFKTLRLKYNSINNALVSIGYCLLIGLIAATRSDVSQIVALGGASFGILIVFIFPTYAGIKSGYTKKPITSILIKIYLVFMIVAMFYLTYRALIPFFNSPVASKRL
jgi:hypothetical protein